MKIFAIKTATIICLIVLSVQVTEAQKRVQKKVPTIYCEIDDQDVVNYLLPRYFVGTYFGYAMSLRYAEPFEPEVQLNIFHPERGSIKVDLYRVLGKSIALQIADIKAKTKNPTFQQIVRQIKIEKIRVNITENEVLKIKADFLESVRKSSEFEERIFNRSTSEIPLQIFDRTYYEVEYLGIGNIRLSSEGNEIAGKPADEEPPFVDWMRSVYKIVKSKVGQK